MTQTETMTEEATIAQHYPIVVSVVGSKGGAGKTSICAALASAMVFAGKKVLLIDADIQKSLFGWAVRAKQNGFSSDLITATRVKSLDELDAALDDAFDRSNPDFVVIDTAGIAGEWAQAVVASSNLVITPVILTENNVDGAIKTHEWFQRLKERADKPEDMPAHIILLTRLERTLGPHEKKLLDKAKKELNLFNLAIRDRKAYRHMESDGLLGEIAREKKLSDNAMERGQAKHYIEALSEMSHIFNDMLLAADKEG